MTFNLFTRYVNPGRNSYIKQSLARRTVLLLKVLAVFYLPTTLATKPLFKANDINVHLCRHTELLNKEINPLTLTFRICSKKYLRAEILSTGEKKRERDARQTRCTVSENIFLSLFPCSDEGNKLRYVGDTFLKGWAKIC